MNIDDPILAAVLAYPPDDQEDLARQLAVYVHRLPSPLGLLVWQQIISNRSAAADVAKDAESPPTVGDRELAAFQAVARGLRESLQPAHASD
jgi:hypothetical protein